jgi:hypothetical protein
MDAAKRDLSDAAFSFRVVNTRGNALQASDGDDSDNSDNSDNSDDDNSSENYSGYSIGFAKILKSYNENAF